MGVEFVEELRKERLSLRRARIASFAGPETAKLDTEAHSRRRGVFGTGSRQDVFVLEPSLRDCVWKRDRFHLYRHILPPEEPHLGFVGYASWLGTVFTAEIAALWLSECFRGELPLPDRAEMDREIARVRRWASEVSAAGRRDSGACGRRRTGAADEHLSRRAAGAVALAIGYPPGAAAGAPDALRRLGSSRQPVTVFHPGAAPMQPADVSGAEAVTPIERGTAEVRVDVRVRWAIRE